MAPLILFPPRISQDLCIGYGHLEPNRGSLYGAIPSHFWVITV
jgi:hypothetical protein